MAEKVGVLIVDDHPVFRQGLRNVLEMQNDLEIVGEVADGDEAVILTQELHPDVVLMDINLPTLNGLQATRKLKELCPEVRVIMLTAYDDEEQVYHAIQAGASAYHSKDVEPGRLMHVIRQVNQGWYVVDETVFDEDAIGDWLLEKFRRFGGGVFEEEEQYLSPLTSREMEILELVVQGLSNRKIAYHLGISNQTVKNHMSSVLKKLGVAGRTEAAVYALRRGWVPLRKQRYLDVDGDVLSKGEE